MTTHSQSRRAGSADIPRTETAGPTIASTTCKIHRSVFISFASFSCLPPVPHPGDLGLPHLALKLEDAVHEGLAGRGAAGDVDVDGNDAVAAADDAVAVVVVAAAVGAAAHADDPAGLGHLIVDLAQGGSHLVGQGTGDDHDIGLARGGTENDTQAVLIVPRGGQVHHLEGAAGETEGHGPEGRLPSPVDNLVEGSQGVLNETLGGLLAGQRDFPPRDAGEAGGGAAVLGQGGRILLGCCGDGGGRRGGDGGLEGNYGGRTRRCGG